MVKKPLNTDNVWHTVDSPSFESADFDSLADLHHTDGIIVDQSLDDGLRPSRLEEFVGQTKVCQQLDLLLKASILKNKTPDHILFSGPPGLGKTTLSLIVAKQINAQLRMTSGPALQNAAELASVLSGLGRGDVLFIDEIHRTSRSAEEMLYLAMEDFRIDIIVGKGAGAQSIPLELEPFTIVGATTRSGLLPGPLRDRFGFTAHLEFYNTDELCRVLARTAKIMNIKVSEDTLVEIAIRSRGTPRIANRLLRRVSDWALVHGLDELNLASARSALELYDVDDMGLDKLDRSVLGAIVHKFSGGPVGIRSIAVTVGEEQDVIESVVEPFLVRQGLIARTQRGRVATPLAYKHFGLK